VFLLNINKRINKWGPRGLNPVKQSLVAATLVVIVLIAAAGIYAAVSLTNGPGTTSTSSTTGEVIPVVAAENFWGSLVSQLGGVHVNVTSIVSDPNTDPHQYQSNPADAIAIANAKLVIVNGMDYDTWASLLINASNTPGQIVISAQKVVGLVPDQMQTINGVTSVVNPHLWYSPYYVNDTVHAMYKALVKIDPGDTSYFSSNYASLNSSLYSTYMAQEEQIKAQFGGIPYGDGTAKGGTSIAATESIVIFLANATGLNIITPQGFMRAIAEGDDPSPADIATFQNQLAGGNQTVACLVYNIQTLTPVTQQLKAEAAQYEIPITTVSETLQPPNLSFQAWMQGEVAALQNCLNSQALGS